VRQSARRGLNPRPKTWEWGYIRLAKPLPPHCNCTSLDRRCPMGMCMQKRRSNESSHPSSIIHHPSSIIHPRLPSKAALKAPQNFPPDGSCLPCLASLPCSVIRLYSMGPPALSPAYPRTVVRSGIISVSSSRTLPSK
jgi:hypothetical protein